MPEHNAWAEFFNGERCVPRALAVGLTAARLDRIPPGAQDRVQRARFSETACAAIEAAVQGIEDDRARRRAELEAVHCTLEQFGLVTRTRGRGPATCSKAERTFVTPTPMDLVVGP
jgi:hypothetical protein